MSITIFKRNNLAQELLLTKRQISKLRNSFENNISADIKFPRTQIYKMIQPSGLLRLLLSKILMKVVSPLAKNILAPLGITTAASAINAGIQKKIHGSGAANLIISNEETNDIMKIVQAVKDTDILLKGVTEKIKNETKEQEGGFLGMLSGTLGARLSSFEICQQEKEY